MESPLLIGVILIVLVLVCLASGMWVSLALGLVGMISLFFFVGGRVTELIGAVEFNALNLFAYTAIPLFVFMGTVILSSGMSQRLYEGATSWVGFLPGGLLHTNIAACAFFAAISGSSSATSVTIGIVAVPELERRGYDRRLIAGSIAAGGTLGILIPPSLGFIVYGAFVQESIGQLFIAGVFPGLTLSALFMLYIGVHTLVNPGIAPDREKASLRAMARSVLYIWPMLVLIFVVLGTIYLGVATPTESAALGVVMALVFSAFYRRLNWQVVKEAGLSAIRITSWVMFIVVGAMVLSLGLSFLRVPQNLVAWAVSLGVNRFVMLAIVVLIYIVFGMFLDSTSMVLVTLPVVYPLMMGLGFDSVWFGVLIVVMMEMANVTPPVGISLYVVHGMMGQKNFNDIVKGITPFFICMNILVVLLVAFPSLALWLPRHMIR